MAAYEKSRVELDRVTGNTLVHNGIDIADAERGKVTKMPSVPGTIHLDNVIEHYEGMAPDPAVTPAPPTPAPQ
jgi:hypothetical protein